MMKTLWAGLLGATLMLSCKTTDNASSTESWPGGGTNPNGTKKLWVDDTGLQMKVPKNITFWEEMLGYILPVSAENPSNLEDDSLVPEFEKAYEEAQKNKKKNYFSFNLDTILNVNHLENDDPVLRHGKLLKYRVSDDGRETGFIKFGSDEKHKVIQGDLGLFSKDHNGVRKLRYTLKFSKNNQIYYLYGFKIVRKDKNDGKATIRELWDDTTTLYTTIFKDNTNGAKNVTIAELNALSVPKELEIVGRGILRVTPTGYIEQLLRTKGITENRGLIYNAYETIGYQQFFMGQLIRTYLLND